MVLPITALAGVFWVVSPQLVWHAQDARHYSTYIALSMLGWLTLQYALERGTRRMWLLTIIVQASAAYLFYFEIFSTAARAVYALLYTRKSSGFFRVFAVYCLLGVILLPFGVLLLGMLTGSEGGYEGNTGTASLISLIRWFVLTLIFNLRGFASVIGGIAISVLVLFGALSLRSRAALLLWIIIPIACVFVVSLNAAYFHPRYTIMVLPGVLIALAAAIIRIALLLPRRQTFAMAVGGIGFALIFVGQIYAYFFVLPPKSLNWPGLTAYLDVRTDAASVILSDSLDPAFEYYYHGAGKIVFLTSENDPVLDVALAEYQNYWLLRGPQTEWAEQRLRQETQYVADERWPGIIQYRAWAVDEAEIEHPVAIRIGDIAVFRGYSVVGDSVLLLYWEALAPTEVSHSFYTRLFHDGGQEVLDHGLAHSTVPTTIWIPGGLYRDPLLLPETLGGGNYELRVGLYPVGTDEMVSAACDTPENGCLAGSIALDR